LVRAARSAEPRLPTPVGSGGAVGGASAADANVGVATVIWGVNVVCRPQAKLAAMRARVTRISVVEVCLSFMVFSL